MTIQQFTQRDCTVSPCCLTDLSDQDLTVLRYVLQSEEERLERIEEKLQAVAPREAGVTDTVYEVLNAYRAGQELLVEELSYQLSDFLRAGKDPHLQQKLLAMLEEEMKSRGLDENVI